MVLEQLMFKKVELWLVTLIVLFALIGALIFGWAVRHELSGGERLGAIGDVALAVASAPSVVGRMITPIEIDLLAPEQRFPGDSGFSFTYERGSRPASGYLLLSRYDGDVRRSVVELIDLNDQDVVHRWVLHVNEYWRMSDGHSNLINLTVDHSEDRFRAIHPLLLDDGSLVVKSHQSPLFRLDACLNLMWINSTHFYHHSTAMDAEGHLWAPAHLEPKTVPYGMDSFMEDAVVKLSQEGEVLYSKSVVDILENNGLGYLVYGFGPLFGSDPIHLNDITPVLEDGTLWKRGDIFLSMRNRSLVVLYRPETDEIVWHKAGIWLHQHDVRVIDENTITVFDNNYKYTSDREGFVDGVNDLVFFNVPNNEARSPFNQAFQQLDIRTPLEGRGEQIDADSVLVEETDYGRIVKFDAEGAVQWQYINRANDNKIYRLSWSRLVPRDVGDRAKQKLQNGNCTDA